MNTAAGITLYNPELDRLGQNIESILPQVKHIFLVDNGSCNLDEIKSLLDKFENVTLICNGENLGIAKALNQMCQAAYENGYEWMLTLDQDSVAESELIKKYSRYTEMEKVAILTPYFSLAFLSGSKCLTKSSNGRSHKGKRLPFLNLSGRAGSISIYPIRLYCKSSIIPESVPKFPSIWKGG